MSCRDNFISCLLTRVSLELTSTNLSCHTFPKEGYKGQLSFNFVLILVDVVFPACKFFLLRRIIRLEKVAQCGG